jgi:hypothetical protein
MPKKPVKETKQEELKTTIYATAEQSVDADTSAYGEPLKLTDDQHKEIIKDINNHIETVVAQRKALGLEDEWHDAIDLYDGNVPVNDFPYDNAPNLHIHVTSMTCDILKVKIKKTVNVKPMMIAQPVPGMQKYQKFSVKKKESYINNNAFGEMDLENELDPVKGDAIKLGTGIAKIYHCREIEPVRMLEVYEPTVQDETRFTEDFEEDKNNPEYKKNLNELRKRIREGDKNPLEIWLDKEQIVKYQPVVKWVDPFNVYLDCHVPLRFQRIIPEKRPEISWYELRSFFDNEYFEDKNILDELKRKYKADDEYRKRKYTLVESNYIFKMKQGKQEKEIRCIMTYVEEYDQKLCKAITFPYITNRPNYEIYTIIPRRGSIYGVGIPKLLKDTNIALNNMWNLMMASAEFTVAPMMVGNITSPTFDPSMKKFGPATMWWLGANDKLAPMQHNHNIGDGYKLIEFLHRYAEWITGISAYMSGRESPLDPNAPASKAYMLLQESNLRINEYIKQIGYANSRLFDQIDKLYYQYYINDKKYIETKSDEKEYSSEDITHKELGIPVNWVPQLSDISTNKALEKEENMKIGTFLLSQPMIAKLPNAMKAIYEIMLRSAGGEWEKQIDVLLPSSDETNIVNKVVDLMNSVGPKGVMDIMAQLMQAGQAAMPGGAPAPEMATGMTNPAEGQAGIVPENMIPQGQ